MKLCDLLSIVMTTMFFALTSARPTTQTTPDILQKLLSTLGPMREGSADNTDVTSASFLIPRLIYTLSQDYEYIVSHDTKQRHVRRGAPFPRKWKHGRRPQGKPDSSVTHGRNRGRYNRPRCVMNQSGECRRIVKCGFLSPIDRISRNPKFGCNHLPNFAASRKW
uniref:Secreted protein n=1 Tax=Ciona savignyi TaxID=51511 RepID=H2ZIK8_CIOSA